MATLHHRSLASLALIAVSTLAGCSASDPPPASSGVLAMSIESETPVCTNTCSDPRRVGRKTGLLVGATARGADAARRLHAVSSDDRVAKVTNESVSCVCEGSPDPIAVDASCASTSKTCHHVLRIATGDAGEVVLAMRRDDDDVLIDSLPISVRDAVGIVAVVRADGPRQTRSGRTLVYRGAPLAVLADPIDADQQRLVHDASGMTVTASNAAVVTIDPAGGMKAQELGSATLSVTINGVSTQLGVDVVAR